VIRGRPNVRGGSKDSSSADSRDRLYPNVDSYSGLIYRALAFPVGMCTVLFDIGRLPGWIARWREMMTDPDSRIGRPR
jgi:citrate synthase